MPHRELQRAAEHTRARAGEARRLEATRPPGTVLGGRCACWWTKVETCALSRGRQAAATIWWERPPTRCRRRGAHRQDAGRRCRRRCRRVVSARSVELAALSGGKSARECQAWRSVWTVWSPREGNVRALCKRVITLGEIGDVWPRRAKARNSWPWTVTGAVAICGNGVYDTPGQGARLAGGREVAEAICV